MSTAAVFGATRLQARERSWMLMGCCALFAAIVCLRLAIQYRHVGGLYLEDDAYYYTLVAQNIAQSGRSTFDGQVLTNGYHPLWLLVLVAQYALVGPSVYVTLLIELALATAGLWFSLASFRSGSVLFRISFTVAFTFLAWPMIDKGMEVSLLIFALGLFTREALARRDEADNALALGLACVLCIGARIDAAVFVLPVLFLVSGSLRRVLPALMPVAIAVAVYAVINLRLFGMVLPVSGAIKSLGGLQWNAAFFDQTVDFSRGSTLRSAAAFANSFIGRPLLVFVLAALALPFLRPSWKSWPLCVGFLAGFLLFAVKIVFFSSWIVWPWYAFPAIIGLVVVFHALEDIADAHALGLDPRWARAGIALVLAVALLQLPLAATKTDKNFESLNIDGVAKFGPMFAGAPVAMGDRAGSFAAHYPGAVVQLEGLVNDRTYFAAIKAHEDIKPLLCRRGVRFVLAYQRDLGRYASVRIPAMRPYLTRFPSPTLTFTPQDEIGRVFDLAKYDNSAQDDGDNYLYAWRLAGCESVGSP